MEHTTSEIRQLKALLLEELEDIKCQIKKNICKESTTGTAPSETSLKHRGTENANKKHASYGAAATSGKHSSSPKQSCNEAGQSKQAPRNAFILGDSLTKVLSTRRMSKMNLKVAVKTHPGGRVRTAENTILNIAQSDLTYAKSIDAFVLHIGTNNVSDADTIETIIDEFKDITNTINNVNPKAKVIISSILPRKQDRLVNKAIQDTNKAVENWCQSEGYTFLDNSFNFSNNTSPDSSLYKDNIHLNSRGGNVLGTAISKQLELVLGLPDSSDTFGNQDKVQNFQQGRSTGRNVQQTGGRPIPVYFNQWKRTRNQPVRQQYQQTRRY